MLKAVLFDMDGTLTQPLIDWREVRRQLAVPEGASIMDQIESLDGDQRQEAELLLKRIEYQAATQARPNPGVVELLERLHESGLRTGLVTNNHERAMMCVVRKLGLQFDLLLSREDGVAKPAPDLLLLALRRLNVDAADAVFVGDGHYDRAASAAAKVSYIHLDPDRAAPQVGPTIHALTELWPFIEPLGAP